MVEISLYYRFLGKAAVKSDFRIVSIFGEKIEDGYVRLFEGLAMVLFRTVEGPQKHEKPIFHIEGYSQHFHFETSISNACGSARLSELLHLCDVDISKIDDIKASARNAVVHNNEIAVFDIFPRA